ncbi:MAG: ATP-binding protein [Saprospiraceae bacterium]
MTPVTGGFFCGGNGSNQFPQNAVGIFYAWTLVQICNPIANLYLRAMFYPRQIESTVLEHSQWYPIIYLGGPRQSGKTTLLQNLFPALPYSSLEDPDVQLLASQDPRRFLNAFPNGAILDEAQRVPHLFSYLQTKVDADKSLRFVLSGSQNFLLMEKITQSLAGRVGILNLLPFSHFEIQAAKVDTSLEASVWRGGYPALYNSTVPQDVFFNNYLQTYLERDVRSLKNVGDLSLFGRFMRLCAGRIGQPLNMSNLATDASVAVNTIKAWLSVLEASYMIFMLPPYHNNFNKRLTKSPKMYFFDTGLVCHLLGISAPSQLETHHYFGNVVENYLIAELYKKRTNRGQRPSFWFWQDHKNNEVDLLIEEGGKTKAVEIKSSQTFNPRLLSGLQSWKNLSGSTPALQYLVYAGAQRMDLELGQLMPWQAALEEL